MLRNPRVWIAAIMAPATGGALLDVADIHSLLIQTLTLAFLLLAPAVSVASLLPGLDVAARAIVSGAASTCILASIAEIMLNVSHWSIRGGVAATVAVCAVLVLASRLPIRRRRDALSNYMPGVDPRRGGSE